MTERRIAAAPLTRADYAPYGDVVSGDLAGAAPIPANHGTAEKWGWLAALENLRSHARPNVSLFRAAALERFPHVVERLEKHPASTQMFVPMNARRFLVAVALGDQEPDLTTLRAFIVPANAGITYRPGVWHHGLLALEERTDFVGLVWEDDTPNDCTEVVLALRTVIDAPS